MIKEKNALMDAITISDEEFDEISRNYENQMLKNHPQETDNPLKYILDHPVPLENELIELIRG